jgi:ABC-type uncharacterized transport system substrate-binding protein
VERRAFIGTLTGGLLTGPLAAEAQQAGKRVTLVGLLAPGSGSDPLFQPYVDVFRRGLRDIGYVEDQSIVLVYRWAEGKYERLPDLAAELVRLKVDVIVAVGTVVAQAAKQATQTIPIVMTNVDDPVATGLVVSVARPGGNITGLSINSHELVGKQLGLLREVVPKVSRVAVLWNPANLANAPQLREAEVAALALGVRLQPLGAQGPSEIDRAFAAMREDRVGALLVLLDSMLLVHNETGSQTSRQRTAYRRFTGFGGTWRPEALWPTARTFLTWFAAPSATWIGSSKAQSPLTSPSNNPPGLNW